MLIALGEANTVVSGVVYASYCRNGFANHRKVGLVLVRHCSRSETFVMRSSSGCLCSSALVAGVHAKCLLLRLSAGRQSITKRSKINHCARACADNHLMPTFSLWVSPRTKLSTAMSSETQLLSRRPDKKPRSKTGKNKLFFQKLRCFGFRCLLFASFFFFLRACA